MSVSYSTLNVNIPGYLAFCGVHTINKVDSKGAGLMGHCLCIQHRDYQCRLFEPYTPRAHFVLTCFVWSGLKISRNTGRMFPYNMLKARSGSLAGYSDCRLVRLISSKLRLCQCSCRGATSWCSMMSWYPHNLLNLGDPRRQQGASLQSKCLLRLNQYSLWA